jgi:hypothetical protein
MRFFRSRLLDLRDGDGVRPSVEDGFEGKWTGLGVILAVGMKLVGLGLLRECEMIPFGLGLDMDV